MPFIPTDDMVLRKRPFFFLLTILTAILLGQFISDEQLAAHEPPSAYFAQEVAHYPGEPSGGIALVGDYLYAGFGYELVIFPTTDEEANWQPVASLTFQNVVTEIEVVDQRAYVLTTGGMHVVDVGEAERPFKLGFFPIFLSSSIKVAQQRAYIVGFEGQGLSIVDVANPHNPVQMGFHDLSEISVAAVQGHTLYLLRGRFDDARIQAFSVVEPTQLQLQSSLSLPDETTIFSADVANDYLYVMTSTLGGCSLGGCSRANHVRVLTLDTLQEAAVHDVSRSGKIQAKDGYLYLLSSDSLFNLFLVLAMPTPLTLQQVSEIELERMTSVAYLVKENQAFLAIEDFGLQQIELAEPEQLEFGVGFQSSNFDQIIVDEEDELLFALDSSEQFRIINIADVVNPQQLHAHQLETNIFLSSHAVALTVSEQLAYILWADIGEDRFMLEILDVSTPTEPTQISTFTLSPPVNANTAAFANATMQLVNQQLYLGLSAKSDLFTIIDVSDPTLPQQLDAWFMDNFVDMTVIGDVVILRDSENLEVIDISAPDNFILLGTQLAERSLAGGLAQYSDYLYLTERLDDSTWRLLTFDASNPTMLQEVSVQNLERAPQGLRIFHEHLYVIYQSDYLKGQLDLFSLAEPQDPMRVASLFSDVASPPTDLAWTNNLLYLASRSTGLSVWRLHAIATQQYLPLVPHHFSVNLK